MIVMSQQPTIEKPLEKHYARSGSRLIRVVLCVLLASSIAALCGAAPALADFGTTEGWSYTSGIYPGTDLGLDYDPYACYVAYYDPSGQPVYYCSPNSASDSVTVNWGDGSSTAGTASLQVCDYTYGAGCWYYVDGTHTYGDAGSYPVSYTSSLSPTGASSGTATVYDAYIGGTDGGTLSAVEGVDSSVTIGTIDDSNASAQPTGEYSVSIDWGDGSHPDTTSGAVSGSSPSAFSVTGDHVYGEENTYHVTATITDDDGLSAASPVTVNATVIVRDAPLSVTAASGLSATQNAPSGILSVAHFTDGDQFGMVTDYTATLDWGDGQVTSGSIAAGNGGFDVSGQHTYTSTGNYKVIVTIKDEGGAATQATTSVAVSSPPPPARPAATTAPASSVAPPAPASPVAMTAPATSVAPTSAVLNASVDPQGGGTARFEYSTDPGLIGATATAPQVVPTGLGAVPVNATVTGLRSRTTYYYRVDAIDPTGPSASGATLSFTTPARLVRIDSTMTWSFQPHRGYVTVAAMVVHQVPPGARVEVSCAGKGCPAPFAVAAVARAAKCQGGPKHCNRARRKRPPAAFQTIALTRKFRGHHLGLGGTFSVRIVGSGYIGKIYIFKIMGGIQPRIACLAPGSSQPGQGC